MLFLSPPLSLIHICSAANPCNAPTSPPPIPTLCQAPPSGSRCTGDVILFQLDSPPSLLTLSSASGRRFTAQHPVRGRRREGENESTQGEERLKPGIRSGTAGRCHGAAALGAHTQRQGCVGRVQRDAERSLTASAALQADVQAGGARGGLWGDFKPDKSLLPRGLQMHIRAFLWLRRWLCCWICTTMKRVGEFLQLTSDTKTECGF